MIASAPFGAAGNVVVPLVLKRPTAPQIASARIEERIARQSESAGRTFQMEDEKR